MENISFQKACYAESIRSRRMELKNKQTNKKSHHISTEPFLNVIHDWGLGKSELWAEVMGKPEDIIKETTKNKTKQKSEKT